MDPLEFEPVSDTNVEDLGYIAPSLEDKKEASRYDQINDIQEKRKQFILDIKNGEIDSEDFPMIVRKFARDVDISKLENGKYLIKNSSTPIGQMFLKFVLSGKIWKDRPDAVSAIELNKLITKAAEEILRYIPIEYDHPTRKLHSMQKNGELIQLINDNLKKKHYDLFDQEWIDKTIKPMVLQKLFDMRKEELQNNRGKMNEQIDSLRIKLKNIFNLPV